MIELGTNTYVSVPVFFMNDKCNLQCVFLSVVHDLRRKDGRLNFSKEKEKN